MTFAIDFYNERVRTDIASLPKTLLARFIALADRMEQYGPDLGEPHTQCMGAGLFEMRLKGAEDIARVFYCSIVDRKVVMLHSFVKKSQQTPPQELEVARKRLLEVKRVNV
ncbi:type II toxin-antitoxin system RelE/ParE family toxin [Paraburkholderia sp. DHOC27]|uniref:type II toxin-antitoxin system RelE/ParE family toxin n=1 Tax=Paraburkholderia sp. DHOC27 TaxID=2303330 RepID=UPI000E3E0D75|nr:type II toxin-antitoxin system RelE/ParE family toxin [Paraburkholderia sp. DHOC27]RFU44136.1 type II toxin-antitoxin system RelE/ParE family toxin [Paraburkholderia sp. DHOC27]